MNARTTDDDSLAEEWIAWLCAPLTVPLLFAAEGVHNDPEGWTSAFAFLSFAFGTPLSYATSFAVGYPVLRLLHRRQLDRLWVITGLGVILGAPILVLVLGQEFGSFTATGVRGALYGFVYAAVWWMVRECTRLLVPRLRQPAQRVAAALRHLP